MQISSFETVDGLERKMTIGIDAQEIDAKVTNKLKQLSQTAKIDGFRPGKIPMSVITKRFKSSVRAEVVGESIQDSLRQALEEKSVRPASQPDVVVNTNNEGENLDYTATFEIYPDVGELSVEGLTVDKPVADVPESAVEEMIESWRKMRAEWKEVERASADGDRLTISYKCLLNGEEVEEGSGENATVVLGRKSLIPGFEEGLIGLELNTEKSVDLTLPESHPVAKLAGQAVELKVTASKVEEPILPEVDEKFCESCGIKEGGVEKLKEQVRDSLKDRLEQASKEALKQALFEKLLDNYEIEVPRTMVNNEKSFILSSSGQQEAALTEEQAADVEEQAVRSVKLGLIVGSFVNQHDIKPDQQKAFNLVKEIAMGYENPQKAADNILQDNGMMQRIMASVLEEQAVEKLAELVTVNEVSKDYEEILTHLQGAA